MEGEFVDIQAAVDFPLRDNYPYYGDGTGRSEPVTIRNIKIRSDTDDPDADDLHKKDTMRRSPLFSQPTGTLKYTVKGSDTLNSIALHFESTPTQLMRLNHLSSRMLFPGQTLYVPDPASPIPICLSPSSTTKKTFDLPVVSQKSADVPKVSQSKSSHSSANSKRLLLLKSKSKEEKTPSSRKRGRKSLLRYETEPRPGRVIRDRSHDEDAEESKNFLKLDVKYITDGEGVVSGTMLVTPNAIMFDPNVSDPLVKERGTSPYGVITQMDAVRGAAMYHDISAMNLQTKAECSGPGTCPVYVPENMKNSEKQSPTSPNISLPTADSKIDPPADPEMDTTAIQADPLLRTISNVSDGFVVVVSDIEKSNQMTGTEWAVGSCDSIPDSTTGDEMVQNKELVNDVAESVLHNGEVSCEKSNENATCNDASVCTTTENTVIHEQKDGAEGDVLDKDSHMDQNMNGLPMEEAVSGNDDALSLTDNRCIDSSHLDKPSVTESEKPMSQDNHVTVASKESLPDLVESAEQSMKDTESHVGESGPSELANQSVQGAKPPQQRCSLCNGSLTTKVNSSSEVPGFVDFSSGIFLQECKCGMTAVPDITESLQDTSMTEKELQAIQAEGWEIRRQSDLLSELPDEGKSEPPLEVIHETKKTEDANKEVVLGYNKTNFEEYLPKPAQRYDDPPLYLCLRVGRPMSKTFPGGSSEGKEAVCKRHHKLPEYWFAIPREKADNLYAFFLQWSPDVYGREGNQDDVGFVAVDEELESSLEVVEDFFEEPIGKDWEIITKEEANRRRMTILECEMNLPLPELEGASSIMLEPEHVRKLTKQLPARTEGYSWKNIYSTAEHGYSLRSLYRSMTGIDSPVLMVIRDSSGMIFGALSPCPVRVSEHYYGTGETFLFNFIDWELHVYRWTGENNFFIKGNYNSLTLGGGDGAFGLWLDGDLYRGRSRGCKTFSNPCLAHDEDFIIADLEAWGFGLG